MFQDRYWFSSISRQQSYDTLNTFLIASGWQRTDDWVHLMLVNVRITRTGDPIERFVLKLHSLISLISYHQVLMTFSPVFHPTANKNSFSLLHSRLWLNNYYGQNWRTKLLDTSSIKIVIVF